MNSARLPLYTPTASSIITINNPSPRIPAFNTSSTARKSHDNSLICKAAKSSSFSSITDFDLYELLGVDSSSDQTHIKMAYRGLQKRCHPDIAGPPGHDMAIILNEAYAVLSDPILRLAYDKEQAKFVELRGYTGKPIYSVWCGSETEQRAVFVDEVKCIGCLKCALFAKKTFAVESVYGRARVVAQWADTEDKIKESIDVCPVDCISIVERSNLAALEFLMSKQPRGNVRIGAGNSVGTTVSNIFVDVGKFQSKFKDAMDKASKNHPKEPDHQSEARISAIQAIIAISNWLYWQPNARGAASHIHRDLIRIAQKSTEPNISRLREVAATIKQARETAKPVQRVSSSNYANNDEYWIPSALALPMATKNSFSTRAASEHSHTKESKELHDEDFVVPKNIRRNPLTWGVPLGMANVAAVIVQLQVGEGVAGEVKEHIGGSLALDVVNSSWLQVILAGFTWYLVGMATVELVQGLQRKLGMYKK